MAMKAKSYMFCLRFFCIQSVLLEMLVSGPITALAAESPRCKVTDFGRSTSGPCGGRKEGPQGRNSSVTPLRCVNVEP